MRLANRRFVPIFFDLSNRGAAADPAARTFVIKARKELGGSSVATPPVLFMTTEGRVVGEISNYASAQKVLEKMLAVLKANPEMDEPSANESAVTDGIGRARILYDLVQYDEAATVLRDVQGDPAALLLGHVYRLQKKWAAMEVAFKGIKDETLATDVNVERSYAAWFAKDYAALGTALKDVPKESRRYTEARYFLGLARYHQDKPEEALEIWKAAIVACAQDPWIYRADWAYTNVKQGKGPRMFTTTGPKTSLLKRHGYMVNKNPDLAGPK